MPLNLFGKIIWRGWREDRRDLDSSSSTRGRFDFLCREGDLTGGGGRIENVNCVAVGRL